MAMIKVFKANDTNYNTNGEVILKPIEAIIYKDIEEEYIEVECPLKYADFLVQDNILLVDTLTGRKGYKIHNPIVGYTITAKAWLVWQENPPSPADRGAVISHGKNIKDLTYEEDWDDVVTKLIPIGYKDIRLPEGHLSVPSPYQKVYEKTIEFDLSESLEEQVELLEEEVKENEGIVASLENSIIVLNGRIHACASAKSSLQAEKTALQQRLSQLGNTDPELKEKAIIQAQLPLIDDEIASVELDRQNTEVALTQTQADLTTMTSAYEASKTEYDNLILTDLRNQAQEYLDINKYPRINYDLEAHLNGVYEIGDTVKVKHPDMRVDLLTQVTAYQLDVINMKFRKIEFGTLKISLREVLDDIEEKIDKTKETVKKYGNTVTKYRSEYKRDNEEMVSRFMSELYGVQNGIYGLLQKNQSVFRQTASEISGTVSRVNADLSEDIASLVIMADQIQSTVQNNYTTLDGKISSNTSQITQTASQIRSEVTNTLKSYSTTTQMNSSISQTATQIRSEVSTAINGVNQSISVVEQTANKISWLVKSGTSSSNFLLTDRAISLVASTINLDGYVTFTNLSQVNSSTVINGGNITAGTIKSKNYSSNYRGMSINLDNGTIDSKDFKIKTDGSAEFKGSITAGIIQSSNYSSNYRGMRIDLSNGTLDSKNFKIKSDGSAEFNGLFSGVIEANYIRANGYSCFSVGSSNSLVIGGTSQYYDITNVSIGARTTRIGSSGGTLGFFGGGGSYKSSVSLLSTGAALSTVVSKVNEIINALKSYNLA